MKYVFVFLLVGLTFNSFGQRNEVHFYDSGSINYEYTYNEAGNRDGEQRVWRENGQLQKKFFYVDGRQEGTDTLWRQDGELESVSNYKDGKKDGLSRIWWSAGILLRKINYKDGELDGWRYDYYSNGNVKAMGKFLADGYGGDRRVGIWRYYYSTAVNKEQKSKKEVYTETGDGVLISEQCWDEDGNKIECPE